MVAKNFQSYFRAWSKRLVHVLLKNQVNTHLINLTNQDCNSRCKRQTVDNF